MIETEWFFNYIPIVEEETDPGVFRIKNDAMSEESSDIGIYSIKHTDISEDPSDPGTYLID